MTQTDDLLIELGCEELPARALDEQIDMLGRLLSEQLIEAGLLSAQAVPETFATPRRLAVRFAAVCERQADRELERKGPAEQVALDADGQPSKAALGFARSVGRSFDELEWLETEQGRWLMARITQLGRPLDELLGAMVEHAVRQMAGARSMRWSDREERFLRPVRWLCVLHGTRVVPISLFGLTAGGQTLGHRIHAPGPLPIDHPRAYQDVLARARVVVCPAERRQRITDQVNDLAAEAGLRADHKPDLVAENAGLTEWPQAIIGSFDRAFLSVPEEALICSMQQHQKCFPLRDDDDRLTHRFIAIANLESSDPAAMLAGFERVIRPRLADARFFWDQDRKTPLTDRRERLEAVLFQEKLGSTGAKVRRLEILGRPLAEVLGADQDLVARAAGLCKCDLLTEMVGEFPELQGTMGRYYALADGHGEALAQAIEEHYMPRQAGAELPTSSAGQALALADRLDTVVGIFAAGQKPKGSRDPFALRRAALGIVRILEQTGCALSLSGAVELAAEVLAEQLPVPAETRREVVEFLNERLRSMALERGIANATLHAVASGKPGSVADFMARAQAVQSFADDARATQLIAAYKRSGNLLKQAEGETIGAVDQALFNDPAEQHLHEEILRTEARLEPALRRADYREALGILSDLRDPVDAFFEQVMVMSEDDSVRANRLALLGRLHGLIIDIADLARLGR